MSTEEQDLFALQAKMAYTGEQIRKPNEFERVINNTDLLGNGPELIKARNRSLESYRESSRSLTEVDEVSHRHATTTQKSPLAILNL